MINYKTILNISIVCILMIGASCCGRHHTIVPEFQTSETDSLGVYRLAGAVHYISADNKTMVTISYIQFGQSDSFYQLKLSTKDDGYYGQLTYHEDGTATGYFSAFNEEIPIIYQHGKSGDTLFIDHAAIVLKELY